MPTARPLLFGAEILATTAETIAEEILKTFKVATTKNEIAQVIARELAIPSSPERVMIALSDDNCCDQSEPLLHFLEKELHSTLLWAYDESITVWEESEPNATNPLPLCADATDRASIDRALAERIAHHIDAIEPSYRLRDNPDAINFIIANLDFGTLTIASGLDAQGYLHYQDDDAFLAVTNVCILLDAMRRHEIDRATAYLDYRAAHPETVTPLVPAIKTPQPKPRHILSGTIISVEDKTRLHGGKAGVIDRTARLRRDLPDGRTVITTVFISNGDPLNKLRDLVRQDATVSLYGVYDRVGEHGGTFFRAMGEAHAATPAEHAA